MYFLLEFQLLIDIFSWPKYYCAMQKLVIILLLMKFATAHAWEVSFRGENQPTKQQIIKIEQFLNETLALMPGQTQETIKNADLKII
ncbi:MAG: hypothetical protein JNM93_12025, partial [Bacteriovoracaceae bacterium]|nr:hypothetical protein [Bacteriovoracaceae bacterium]